MTNNNIIGNDDIMQLYMYNVCTCIHITCVLCAQCIHQLREKEGERKGKKKECEVVKREGGERKGILWPMRGR